MKYLIRYKKFAVKWLDKKRGFVKESTYANYACIIHNHIIPILDNYYLRNISNELLQNFIIRKCQEGRLDSSGGLSDKAIKDIVSVLKSSIRYAIKNGYMKYIDLEFYYPNNCNNDKVFVFSKIEQKKLIENAIRVISINKECMDVLKKVRKRDECYILTGTKKYMEPRNLRKYYYKIIDKLGISKLNFHSLRHTFATNCIRLGCDYKTVSELLGHSSVNMTLNIYVHFQMSQKKRCINAMY